MVDKILAPGSGVTYDLFVDTPAEGEEVPAEEPQLDEEGNPIPVPEKEPEEVLPKHMVIPEVVRDDRVFFYRVPKLGSYMAVRLEYETCLFEEALEAGIADQIAVNEKIRAQNEERQAFEKTQQELQEAAEADGDETFKPEEKTWEAIETQPFKTKKVQFVCCMNTMGQDRKFTEEERLFALRTIQKYRDRWEQSERDNLKADIDSKINKAETTRIYKETHEAQDIQELEQRAEAALHLKEGSDPLTDEQKTAFLKRARLTNLSKTFYDPEGMMNHQRQLDRDKLRSSAEARIGTPNQEEDGENKTSRAQERYYPLAPEQWKKPFLDLKHLSLLKHGRVLQALFYLLGYTREQICERGTNCIDFKLAKELINEQLFQKMADYEPLGQKTEEYKAYQKLSFIKKNIDGVSEEAVEDFSLVLRKVLGWLNLVLDVRSEDVTRRRDTVELAKQERDQAIKLNNMRQEKYDKERDERKQAFDEAVEADIQKQLAARGEEEEEGAE